MAEPTPPVSVSVDDYFLAEVSLACVAGVGGLLRKRLVDRFGSPRAVLTASPEELARVDQVGPKLSRLIPTFADDAAAGELITLCQRRGVDILVEGTGGYPRLLGQIDDPPGVLFLRGTLEPCDALAVAIVGARHATAYGRRVAHQLAGGLARAGYTVVSGLARGIDHAAHRGALEAGGRTIAVLGSGVLEIYPPEHADLAVEITHRGAVVSEAPPLAAPVAGAFPRRNRIVSGLTLGTVVVEAADRSGALITARLAGEQGREVFAVPGPVDSRMSRGCHRLIRDGAKLVESIDDILEELGPLFEPTVTSDGRLVNSPAELQLDDVERQVLAAIDAQAAEGGGAVGISIDDLVTDSGLAASRVLAAVGVLEMRRIARRLPGSRVARV
ncbi:MAG: DNA-processing protein DprA [Pirellulales bacterium]